MILHRQDRRMVRRQSLILHEISEGFRSAGIPAGIPRRWNLLDVAVAFISLLVHPQTALQTLIRLEDRVLFAKRTRRILSLTLIGHAVSITAASFRVFDLIKATVFQVTHPNQLHSIPIEGITSGQEPVRSLFLMRLLQFLSQRSGQLMQQSDVLALVFLFVLVEIVQFDTFVLGG